MEPSVFFGCQFSCPPPLEPAPLSTPPSTISIIIISIVVFVVSIKRNDREPSIDTSSTLSAPSNEKRYAVQPTVQKNESMNTVGARESFVCFCGGGVTHRPLLACACGSQLLKRDRSWPQRLVPHPPPGTCPRIFVARGISPRRYCDTTARQVSSWDFAISPSDVFCAEPIIKYHIEWRESSPSSGRWVLLRTRLSGTHDPREDPSLFSRSVIGIYFEDDAARNNHHVGLTTDIPHLGGGGGGTLSSSNEGVAVQR